jgi:hypothetical protein
MNRARCAALGALIVILAACAAEKVLSPRDITSQGPSKVYAPDEYREPPPTCDQVSTGCAWEIQTVVIVAGPALPPQWIAWIDVTPISAPPTWGVYDASTGPYSANGGVNPVDPNCAPGTVPSDNFPIPQSLTEEVCPRLAGTLCIDLWIRDTIVGKQLLGDARDSDPEATPRMSRAQIVIPMNNPGATYYTISPTCAVYMGRTQCYQPLPTGTGGNNVAVSIDPVGSFAVSFTLRNSAMQIPGLAIGFGPAIDGTVSFVSQGNGDYAINIDRNAYPSMAIFRFQNGNFDKLVESTETNPLYLIDWFNNIAPVNSGATCKQP